MLPKPLLVLVCACLAIGCTNTTTLPPIVEGQGAGQIPGKFVWHNLVTTDAEAARRFYGELFGWEFTIKKDGRYSVISYRGKNVGGIVDATLSDKRPKAGFWLTSISVPDVDQALAAAVEAGAKRLEDPRDIAGVGRAAAIEDATGAVVHLLTSENGDPPDVKEPPMNTWLWHELLARDPDRAADFYKNAFGYRVERLADNPKKEYEVLWSSGAPRAGVHKNPFHEEHSTWLPYIRVEDPAAFAKRATELGGRVVVPAHEDIRKGTLAVVVDPSGAPLALQKWSPGDKVLE